METFCGSKKKNYGKPETNDHTTKKHFPLVDESIIGELDYTACENFHFDCYNTSKKGQEEDYYHIREEKKLKDSSKH